MRSDIKRNVLKRIATRRKRLKAECDKLIQIMLETNDLSQYAKQEIVTTIRKHTSGL